MNDYRKLLITSSLSLIAWLSLIVPVAAQPDAIDGLWWTEDQEAVVEFYPCDAKLCGRFHWLKDNDPANPSRDERNPDSTKQQRPLCGLTFIGDFKQTKPNHYEYGWIYSPRHGRNFDAAITLLEENKLELRGYVLTSLFGSSQIWLRAPADSPSCATTTANP